MAVEAIQKNTTYNSNKASIGGSALFGALAGYTFKWALPITPQEKDERYNLELRKIIKDSREARAAEKEAIANSKLGGVDTFIKMDKSGTLLLSEIEKLKDPKRAQVKSLFARMNNAGFKAKAEGKKALVDFTKGIRPTGIFILAGMGLAAGIAFTHNVFRIINAERPQQDYCD